MSNRRSLLTLALLAAFFVAAPAAAQFWAQEKTPADGAASQTSDEPQENPEQDLGPEPAPEMKDFPLVKLRALDKITARAHTFQVAVGATVRFGSLYMKAQSCRKSPPTERPESAAFLQIWEAQKGPSEWVFSGWMFASSPSLSAMDHPIYDVWTLDCLTDKGEITDADFEDDLREEEGEITEETAPAEPEIAPEDISPEIQIETLDTPEAQPLDPSPQDQNPVPASAP